jgi:hypothetical protein
MGGKAQHFPLVILAQNVPDEIVFMQALHYEDDAAGLFVIEPAIKCVIVPGVNRVTLGLRERLIRFQRVINDNEICSSTGQYATDRRSQPHALLSSHEFVDRLPLRREAS